MIIIIIMIMIMIIIIRRRYANAIHRKFQRIKIHRKSCTANDTPTPSMYHDTSISLAYPWPVRDTPTPLMYHDTSMLLVYHCHARDMSTILMHHDPSILLAFPWPARDTPTLLVYPCRARDMPTLLVYPWHAKDTPTGLTPPGYTKVVRVSGYASTTGVSLAGAGYAEAVPVVRIHRSRTRTGETPRIHECNECYMIHQRYCTVYV